MVDVHLKGVYQQRDDNSQMQFLSNFLALALWGGGAASVLLRRIACINQIRRLKQEHFCTEPEEISPDFHSLFLLAGNAEQNPVSHITAQSGAVLSSSVRPVQELISLIPTFLWSLIHKPLHTRLNLLRLPTYNTTFKMSSLSFPRCLIPLSQPSRQQDQRPLYPHYIHSLPIPYLQMERGCAAYFCFPEQE